MKVRLGRCSSPSRLIFPSLRSSHGPWSTSPSLLAPGTRVLFLSSPARSRTEGEVFVATILKTGFSGVDFDVCFRGVCCETLVQDAREPRARRAALKSGLPRASQGHFGEEAFFTCLVCSKVGDGKRVWMYVCVHANVCLRFCSGLCTRVHRHGHITAAHIYIYVCVSSTICI